MTAILSLLFTVMQITGYRISVIYQTSVHRSSFFQNIGILSKVQCIFLAVIEFILWNIILSLLFTFLEKYKAPNLEWSKKKNIILWTGAAVLLFACWIPCFLAGYPGFYNYDAFSQVPQALYEEVQYSAHHPLIHTLIMGKIIAFGYHHGTDLNDGIALHSVLQMAFCAMMFSYMICYVRKKTGRLLFSAVSFCYYAFFPPIPMFAMSTTKDTVFSVLLLFAVTDSYEMCRDLPAFFASKRKMAKFIILSLLMCLFRKNGIYAVVCTVPFVLLLCQKYRKHIVLLFTAITVIYAVVNKGLAWVLDAQPGSAAEMFSVPMQQIARVYNDYGEDAFEGGEMSMIYESISGEDLLRYDPFLSDRVKNHLNFQVIQDNKMDYVQLWAKKGIQYPGTYLKAFLENTYQAWYPGTSIYRKTTITQTSYFDMEMCPGGYRDSKMPRLLEYYDKIATGFYYQKFPFIRLLFSIGAMFWVALFTLCFAIYRKNRQLTVAMLLVLFYCMTVLLGPTSLVRYYLVLFYGFPVYISYLLSAQEPTTNFDGNR